VFNFKNPVGCTATTQGEYISDTQKVAHKLFWPTVYTVITSNFQLWGINTLWAYKPHHMHNYLSQVSSKLAFISEARGL